MRRVVLLSSAMVVGWVFGETGEALAQCVATTDCASLGYTETSCPDGKGIRCPFGTTFACPTSGAGVCEDYGFKYDCTGDVYAAGVGPSCSEKYTQCSCVGGYEWNGSKCTAVVFGTCSGRAKNCTIGQILNVDGSCSDYRVTGVEPIGIVAYISPEGCGQAIALEWRLTNMEWGKKGVDIPNVPNYATLDSAKNDFDSCNNTRKVMAYSYQQYGDSAYTYYNLFKTALDYAPDAAPSTSGKWCVASAGILNNVYENENISAGLEKLGLSKTNVSFWSSTEVDADNGWIFRFIGDSNQKLEAYAKNQWYSMTKYDHFNVLPVIEF